jgi:hypothetical protein
VTLTLINMSRGAETVIIVLETCQRDEVRRMDQDLHGEIREQLEGSQREELNKLLGTH